VARLFLWFTLSLQWALFPGVKWIRHKTDYSAPPSAKAGKGIPLQAWTGPESSRWLSLPDFQTNIWHMKVVRLSVPCTSCLYPRRNIPGTQLLEAESTPVPKWDWRVKSIKIPMTPSGIKPTTFWFVVQCLKQLCHCLSPSNAKHLALSKM